MNDPVDYFRSPSKPSHRQYEALRAYFLDHLAAIEVGAQFGYSPGYIRLLATQFRQGKLGDFFSDRVPQHEESLSGKELRQSIIELRKQHLSIYHRCSVI
jgi:hypothetical protein